MLGGSSTRRPVWDFCKVTWMLTVGTPLVLLAHAAATLFMVGLIWFVQVVHYPLFAKVGPDVFVPYAASHGNLTGLVVGPWDPKSTTKKTDSRKVPPPCSCPGANSPGPSPGCPSGPLSGMPLRALWLPRWARLRSPRCPTPLGSRRS